MAPSELSAAGFRAWESLNLSDGELAGLRSETTSAAGAAGSAAAHAGLGDSGDAGDANLGDDAAVISKLRAEVRSLRAELLVREARHAAELKAVAAGATRDAKEIGDAPRAAARAEGNPCPSLPMRHNLPYSGWGERYINWPQATRTEPNLGLGADAPPQTDREASRESELLHSFQAQVSKECRSMEALVGDEGAAMQSAMLERSTRRSAGRSSRGIPGPLERRRLRDRSRTRASLAFWLPPLLVIVVGAGAAHALVALGLAGRSGGDVGSD